MSDSICRWGILSTAGIARKNWQAIRNSGNGTIVAVASRSVEKAQAFIDENSAMVSFPEAPRALGSYEELLASDDVDAVYIPLPTGVRKEWVLKAAEAGKHIMCEKPCGIHAEDLKEMIAACEKAGAQFMDGVMFMHSKRLDAVREVLNDGESIGDIKRIASQFSFLAPQEFLDGNIRVHSGLEPQGVLGDLGWYTLRIALWTMEYAMPKRLSSRLISGHGREDSPDQVPTEFSTELFFDGGVSASFYVSFLTEHQQWVHISGTKGNLLISDFVLPYFDSEVAFDVHNAHFDLNGCQFNMERHSRRVAVKEFANNHANAQETNLFRNFASLALSGKPDSHWPDIALKTQILLDACLESARADGKMIEL
ncbi:MAG: oxidoreductase [Verrucomicrobiales bacterium]|nr:oxidoreductase [Verrucomicrobiales bacterium]